jgi:hypothetical protein
MINHVINKVGCCCFTTLIAVFAFNTITIKTVITSTIKSTVKILTETVFMTVVEAFITLVNVFAFESVAVVAIMTGALIVTDSVGTVSVNVT